MPFEYEALVGHLYVVGGRAVSAHPPGALVEVAPKRAARGRETDTFFVLVLPSGEAVASASFYERMAQTAAERYFDSTGSVTAGLRQVYNSLNQDLREHNEAQGNTPYEANMITAVLRGSDLIVARVGAAVAMVRHMGATQTVPNDLDNDDAVYEAPLGVKLTIDPKMTRFQVINGTRLIFADANLTELPLDGLTRAIAEADIGLSLIAFKELARLSLTLLAIEFVTPESPAPLPVPEGESTLAIADASKARPHNPVTDAPEQELRRARANKRPPKVVLQTQRGLGAAARTVASGADITSRTIEHYFERPPEPESPPEPQTVVLDDGTVVELTPAPKRRLRLPITGGVAVLIPVVLVAAVVLLWLGSAGRSEFELCIAEANKLAEIAREVPSSSPDNLLATWSGVISAARLCEDLRADDPEIAALIREGQSVVDRINIIERREPQLIQSLEGAQFKRVLMQGTDVYVLDSARNGVYHAILAQDGRSFTQRLEPILDMRQGVTVSGFTLGEFVDISFSQNLDEVFALDKNGVLVTCRRRQKQGCEAQSLLRTEEWVTPVAITVWGAEDRFYVLDPGANQIWRYDRLGGAYSGVPTPYFDGQNRGAISNAVDFAIGRPPSGNVFVLRADGVIIQYFRGQIQEFRLVGYPQGQQPKTSTSMYLDEDPLGQAIYMVVRDSGTIYRFTQGGAHWSTYRAYDEGLFASLAGVVSNPGLELVYVISGNAIFFIEM